MRSPTAFRCRDDAAGDRSEAVEAPIQRPRPNSFTGSRRFQTQFLVYVISFIVRRPALDVARQALAAARDRRGPHVHWSLVHLLLVTCVPFVTIGVGATARCARDWLYCAITILAALVALRSRRWPSCTSARGCVRTGARVSVSSCCRDGRRVQSRAGKVAMWIYLLNFSAPRCAAGTGPEAVTMSTAAKIEPAGFLLCRRPVRCRNNRCRCWSIARDHPRGRDPRPRSRGLCAERLGHGLWRDGIYPFTHYHRNPRVLALRPARRAVASAASMARTGYRSGRRRGAAGRHRPSAHLVDARPAGDRRLSAGWALRPRRLAPARAFCARTETVRAFRPADRSASARADR